MHCVASKDIEVLSPLPRGMLDAWNLGSSDSLDRLFFLFFFLLHFIVLGLGWRDLCVYLWFCLESWLCKGGTSWGLLHIHFICLSFTDIGLLVLHRNNWSGRRSKAGLRGVINDANVERLGRFFKGLGWIADGLGRLWRGIMEGFVMERVLGEGVLGEGFFLGFYRRFWKQRGESGRPVVAPLKSGEREVPSSCEAAHHKLSPLPQPCRYRV